jgi:hypothetical protein
MWGKVYQSMLEQLEELESFRATTSPRRVARRPFLSSRQSGKLRETGTGIDVPPLHPSPGAASSPTQRSDTIGRFNDHLAPIPPRYKGEER